MMLKTVLATLALVVGVATAALAQQNPVTINGVNFVPNIGFLPQSSVPAVCTTSTTGVLYYDSGTNTLRFCNGTTFGTVGNTSTLFTVSNPGIATTSTDGIVVTNPTPATSSVQVQQSPRVRFRGNAWDTAASETVDIWQEVLPVAGASPGAQLKWFSSINGGAALNMGILDYSGNLTLASNVTVGAAASLSMSGAGFLGGNNVTGQFLLRNLNVTAGVGIDVATDSTFKLRTRAFATGAMIDVTTVQNTGTTAVAVNNVGANSCGTTAASIAGNENIGAFVVGATAGTQCRVTFTTAAPTRRHCTFDDETTTISIRSTYVDSTHTDAIGAFTAGDTVTYICGAR